jgi:hypothetical protein
MQFEQLTLTPIKLLLYFDSKSFQQIFFCCSCFFQFIFLNGKENARGKLNYFLRRKAAPGNCKNSLV